MDANSNNTDKAANNPTGTVSSDGNARVAISNTTRSLRTTSLVSFLLAIPPLLIEAIIFWETAGEIDGGPMDITPTIEMICLLVAGCLLVVSMVSALMSFEPRLGPTPSAPRD